MTKKIAIIGLGGVGGYFGFKITQKTRDTKDVKISFVAREKTFEAVRDHGLTLLSPENSGAAVRPDSLFSIIPEMEPQDLILICVKAFDLEQVCEALRTKVEPDTVVLPLMNGVDIYDRVRNQLETGAVLPSCVYVASHIKEKGVIEHQGKPGRIILGKDPREHRQDTDWVVDFLADCGIDVAFKADVFPDIWTKFYFIASFGLISSRYDQPMGAVCEEPALRERAMAIMKEIGQIAANRGIALPQNITGLTFQKAAAFPYHTPTSLQLDIRSKKASNELDLFAGAIVRYGGELGIPVPETEKIYREIQEIMNN